MLIAYPLEIQKSPNSFADGRRAKKPIHDGSQKNELNGYQ
jgi:hypothetical protein